MVKSCVGIIVVLVVVGSLAHTCVCFVVENHMPTDRHIFCIVTRFERSIEAIMIYIITNGSSNLCQGNYR
jgi:hypothetical protein